MKLIERDAQLRELAAAVREAVAGRGRLTCVEGPAGMGKSALLGDLRMRAAEAGARVLTARASELGREYAFGVVRELLSPVAVAEPAGPAAAARAVLSGGGTPAESHRAGLLHALWWVLAAAAEEGPLVLLVDDAQWCDEPSLDFLAHLVPRVHELPVLAIVAGRPDRSLAPLALAPRMALPPLSRSGVGRLVERELAAAPDEPFLAACEAAAGGNPFLTGELLRELRAEGVTPTATAAARVADVRPDTIARAVLVRLARESHAALELARAVAVLGDGAMLRHAAALAGLDAEDAAPVAAALMRADVLADRRPLDFVHAIVRASVYEDMTTAERGAAHARAARLLAGEGASPERVASHLLEAEPAADPWVVDRLMDAAAGARGRGAPEVAAHYLQRALEEPPVERRDEVQLELGRAEALSGAPGGGLERLRAALAASPPGRDRAKLAVELAQACLPLSRFEEAVDTLEAAIEALPAGERELALHLEAMMASAGRLHPSTFPRIARRLGRVAAGARAAATPAERVVLASWAAQQLFEARPAGEALAVAEQVMAAGLLAEQTAGSPPVFDCLFVRVVCDHPERAQRVCDETLADARAGGSLMGIGSSLCFRSHVAYRRGALDDAENDARAALEVSEPGRHLRAAMAVAFLCDALVERRGAGEALELLADRGLEGELPAAFPFTLLLFSRAQARLAAGEADAGIADLRELATRGTYTRNPVMLPWRSALAVALAQRDERAEAGELAREELRLARGVGSSRAEGVALRACGIATGDAAALTEAARRLQDAAAPLEAARALVDAGAMIRRRGDPTAAREPLREGGELAQRCGAETLAARARDELAATGVRRVKRLLLTGVDGLTPSELRVARMAAEGMTNRAIAEALFVTPKTVEVHLGHAYRKLDISSRAELAGVLR